MNNLSSHCGDLSRRVERAIDGDKVALGELLEDFQGLVRSIARRFVTSEHDLDDIKSEVCLMVIRKIGSLRKPAAFVAWLRRITVHLSINFVQRTTLKYVAAPLLVDPQQHRWAEPIDALITEEEIGMVRATIARLRPIDQEVLRLQCFEGRQLDVIARMLNVPLGTVKRRGHVARNRFATAISKRACTS